MLNFTGTILKVPFSCDVSLSVTDHFKFTSDIYKHNHALVTDSKCPVQYIRYVLSEDWVRKCTAL